MSEVNTNTTETTNTEAVAEQKVKLPLRERLAQKYAAKFDRYKDLEAELIELASEIEAIDTLAAVDVGSVVNITIGKGDTAKVVTGTVIGVREDEDGTKSYKVTYGSGFDADIAVVKASKLSVPAATGEAVAEQPAA